MHQTDISLLISLFGCEAGKKIGVGNCTPAAICNYAFLKEWKSSQDFSVRGCL